MAAGEGSAVEAPGPAPPAGRPPAGAREDSPEAGAPGAPRTWDAWREERAQSGWTGILNRFAYRLA